MTSLTKQEAALIADEIKKAMTKLLVSHQTFLSDMSNERGSRRPSKGKNGESSSSSMNINRRLTGSIKNLNSAVGKSSDLFASLNTQLKQSTKNSKQDNVVGGAQQRRVQKNQLRYLKFMARSANDTKHLSDSYSKSASSVEKSGKKVKGELTTFGQALEKYGTQLLSKVGVGKGVATIFSDLQQAMSTSNMYDVEATNVAALQMGITVKDLISLQSSYRTDALRSADGITAWTENLRKSQYDLLTFTGNTKDAAKAAAAIRSTVMDAGISFKEATKVIGSGKDGLVGQLKKLSSATGMTIMGLNDGMKSIISGDETRYMLQKMDKSQRGKFLSDQAKSAQQYTLLTGSWEKARELVIAQQNEGKKTFKERYIAAAKLQAAAVRTGMGVEDAQRMSTLFIKNPSQRNADEQLELTKLQSRLHNNVSLMTGSGDAHTEMMGNVIMDQLGVSDVGNKNLTTYTELNQQSTERHSRQNISAIMDGNSLAKSTLTIQQQIWNTLDNGFVQMVAGFAVLALKDKINPLELFRKSVDGTKGGFMRNAKAAKLRMGKRLGRVGKLAGLAAEGGTIGKALLKGIGKGGIAGLASMGVNAAVDYGIDPHTSNQATAKNGLTGAISGAGYGAMIGSVIPVIGTAVGAAVGGVIGGIVGLLEDTKTDRQFTAEAQQAELHNKLAIYDAEMTNVKKRQQAELEGMSDIFTRRQEAMDNHDYKEAARQQLEIDNVRERHSAEMELITKQRAAAQELSSIYSEMSKSEGDYSKFQAAFADADEMNWIPWQHQIDTGELKDQTGMGAQELLSKVLQHGSQLNITDKEKMEISDALFSGAELEGDRFHDIFTALREGMKKEYQQSKTKLDDRLQQSSSALKDAKSAKSNYDRTHIAPSTPSRLKPVLEELTRPNNAENTKKMIDGLTLTPAERTNADTNKDGKLGADEKLAYIADLLERTLSANERNFTITQDQAEKALAISRKNKKRGMVAE